MAVKQEKSCGFIVYRETQGIRDYLIIRSMNGDYGFPKGHVEQDKTEYETAARELKEETGITVQIVEGFRRQIEYKLPGKADTIKHAVYFLGKSTGNPIVRQPDEVQEAMFVSFEKGLEMLSFEQTKTVLREAETYLITNPSV